MASPIPIPEPPSTLFLGHTLGIIEPLAPNQSFKRIADELGEIYRLRFPGRVVSIVGSQALINEVCDEKRFKKTVNSALRHVRNATNDGLFTAELDEPNWGIAHRVLMPAFGPMPIRGMFDDMHDIATQLTLKWARHEGEPITVTEDFTRLALDTLALCSMGYRFNSYYSEKLHPFIEAMGSFLVACSLRMRRLPMVPSFMYAKEDEQYQKDIEVMRDTARQVVEARKAGKTPNRRDLLTAMLEGVDPKTGRKMTDESIMDNLITFLIAGHETTSGMLSFTFYQLLKNPETYRLAQQEVDDIFGKGPITVDQLSKMQYVPAVLREALRINTPIAMFMVEAIDDTFLGGGKYFVPKGQTCGALISKAHLDPAVWGDDAEEFKPERMLEENFNRIMREFPNCWKPFGNGTRGCIGRPFAWQEALLVMAMLLQNFDFAEDDPDYELEIQESMTLKPKGFRMRATLRAGLTPTTLERRLAGSRDAANGANGQANGSGAAKVNGSAKVSAGKPMTILYGSNSGTCEALAQRIATDAPSHGFQATCIATLDSATGNLPKDQPVVVITASYEGQPPDNANQFVTWIEGGQEDDRLQGVDYAVFGCGHHDWAATFHRIPKLVDQRLATLGAHRVAALGLTDVAKGDAFTEFENWEDETLWPALQERYGVEAGAGEDATGQVGIDVVVSTPRSTTLRQDLKEAVVVESNRLTAEGEPVKTHIELKLPEGMPYRPGDYLAVLPINPKESVQRAMRRFQLPWDAHVKIAARDSRQSSLPTGVEVAAYEVMSAYVELSQPATKRNVLTLTDAAKDPKEKAALTKLADTSYADEISTKRVSILELLERYPSVDLPLGTFLSMLPPMRVRQYSISSSPLWNPNKATLTLSVLRSPALSGHPLPHLGVASTYLDSLAQGDALQVAVRPAHAAFHLPEEPERQPLLCIAAGAGFAPFRGFIQDRAAMLGAGRKLAPMVLFFGCRAPGKDDLYAEELARWEAQGAVKVYWAYSRAKEGSDGCGYVQERVWAERKMVGEMWEAGAKVFVCGSRKVANGLKETFLRMRIEAEKEAGRSGEVIEGVKPEQWFEGIRNERYVTDVFD